MSEFFDLLGREALVRVFIVAEVWIAFALGYLTCYLGCGKKGSE